MLTEANEGDSPMAVTWISKSYYSKHMLASVFQITISKIKRLGNSSVILSTVRIKCNFIIFGNKKSVLNQFLIRLMYWLKVL